MTSGACGLVWRAAIWGTWSATRTCASGAPIVCRHSPLLTWLSIGVALALPALMRAEKLQRRAARVGFDWPDISGPLAKCHEEIGEIEQALQKQDQDETAAEIGDLLFSVVNLARFAGVDAEESLRRSSLRFSNRFRRVENAAEMQQRVMAEMSLEELDALWNDAKKEIG